jgi:hypothetical protein
VQLNTELDNMTGREDRDGVTGDQIHAWKCIIEIPNDGTKETGFLIHCIVVQVQGTVRITGRERPNLLYHSNYRCEKPFITGREGPDF